MRSTEPDPRLALQGNREALEHPLAGEDHGPYSWNTSSILDLLSPLSAFSQPEGQWTSWGAVWNPTWPGLPSIFTVPFMRLPQTGHWAERSSILIAMV